MQRYENQFITKILSPEMSTLPTLMKLEYQTGYDLLVEQDKSAISKFTENINISSIGSAMEMVGSVIPIPGVRGLIKSIGKTIKETKNGK